MAGTVSEYLEQIHQKTGGSQCVYGGQADARWPLQSSADRRIQSSIENYGGIAKILFLKVYHENLLLDACQKVSDILGAVNLQTSNY